MTHRPKRPASDAPIKTCPLWFFALFAVAFSLQVLPNLFKDSDVADERLEIADGFYYWGGDVVSHHYHPPVATALQGLPLRLKIGKMPLPQASLFSSERAEWFFRTLGPEGSLWALFHARIVTWLFGLILGFLLWDMSRRRPAAVAWATMALWAFEPTLGAFSGLALSDLPLAALFLLAVRVWVGLRRKPFGPVLTGALAAAAACAKFSGLVLLPVLGALEFLELRGELGTTGSWMRRAALFGLGFLAAVGFVYLPGTLKIPGHPSPWSLAFSGLWDMAGYKGHPTFFLGVLSHSNHLAYYPVAFVLKTATPFLLLLAAAKIGLLTGRLKLPAHVWLPGAAFFLAIIPTQNLGVRYLLPAVPFFILAASEVFGALWEEAGRKGPTFHYLTAGLLVWQAGVSLAAYPNRISFFNEFVPASAKWRLLGDSNFDFGQNRWRLAAWLKGRGAPPVKVPALFDWKPDLGGYPSEKWKAGEEAIRPQPGFAYALDAGYEQLGAGFDPRASAITGGWVKDLKPDVVVAETWKVWLDPAARSPQATKAPQGPESSVKMASENKR